MASSRAMRLWRSSKQQALMAQMMRQRSEEFAFMFVFEVEGGSCMLVFKVGCWNKLILRARILKKVWIHDLKAIRSILCGHLKTYMRFQYRTKRFPKCISIIVQEIIEIKLYIYTLFVCRRD